MGARRHDLPRHVRRHRDRFRAVFAVGGERHVSPTFPTAAEAAAYAAAVLRAARAGADQLPTLARAWELVDQELVALGARPDTCAYYAKQRAIVEREIPGSMILHEIDEALLQRYARKRIEAGVSARVVWHKELGALSRALGMAERAGLLQQNPMRRVRRPPNRQKGYAMLPPDVIAEALERMRAANQPCAARDADIVELSFCLSLRRRELSRIEAGHVDLRGERLFVVGKNSETYVPISARARPLLERFLARGGSPLIGSWRLIEKVFARWSKRLALEGRFSPQVMRHSFGTALARGGLDGYAIQNAMRHQSLRTTQRYLDHEAPDRARAALDALPTGRSRPASGAEPDAPPPSNGTR